MSTVGEVADRVFRDWLVPPDDQPVIGYLEGDITAGDLTWNYADSTLAPDEEDLIAPGTLIEVDTELMRINSVDYDAQTMDVVRGVSGTTATEHSTDAEVRVAPAFTRNAVVEAVKDNVVALYPSLWQVGTEQLTTSDVYVEVPAEVVTPVSFLWLDGSRYRNGVADLLDNFPPSSTGKAVQFHGLPSGKTGYFTYRGKFARPASESSELSDLGVDATWERIVAVGAAAQVVGQRPLDSLTAEYITEQLEREALPPGSATDIRNGLLTLHNIFLDEANRSLRAQMQTPVVYNMVMR